MGDVDRRAGEAAALLVALLWAFGSLVFAWLSGRIGAFRTNLARITLAAIILALVVTAMKGSPLPREASGRQLALLAASGVIGLVLADYGYFRALLYLGPRRATLLSSLAPAFTALLGGLFLGERLGVRGLGGIALTLGGIALVILERSPGIEGMRRIGAGTLAGLVYAVGQATALILAKGAMTGLDTVSVASLRLSAAAVVAWGLAAASGRIGGFAGALAPPRVASLLVLATLTGPVAGMGLSMYAIRHTETAVAATLMALVPVIVIPLTAWLQRERPTPRAIAGAVVAVAGVALLVSRG